jgi:hypothetical protein
MHAIHDERNESPDGWTSHCGMHAVSIAAKRKNDKHDLGLLFLSF